MTCTFWRSLRVWAVITAALVDGAVAADFNSSSTERAAASAGIVGDDAIAAARRTIFRDGTLEREFGVAAGPGKLVDLTGTSDKTLRLSEGADFVETALVRDNGRLFGLFARSDDAFSDFISPASNPLFFEDPRTLTEVRVHFANQWIPGDNPVFQGGTAQFAAAQVRVALTQRLSIIANKDGYLCSTRATRPWPIRKEPPTSLWG